MRRIGWGRQVRAALKAEGITRTSKACILDSLREHAAEMGTVAANAFWPGIQDYPDLPQDIRDAVALDVSAKVDACIHSILKEWRIPRSAESERMAEAAEAAFRARLGVLAEQAGGAA